MRRMRRTASYAAAAAMLLTACTGESDRADEPETALTWEACEGALAETGLECAAVEVPLDWDDPGGETIDIALSRRPADDPERRIGALLVNPGGPGAPGTSVPAAADASLGTDVVARFDIVGFDPRGTGRSAEVSCEATLATTVPADQTEYDQALENRRRQAEACADANPQLPYLDTVSAARDVEAIREALGEDRVSWYGWSYGTQLGATYAELFPDRVHAAVFDAMYDHTRPGPDLVDEQAAAREAAFDRFSDWCEADRDCLPGTDDVAGAWDALVARAQADPLPADVEHAPETVGGDMVVDATAALLASPDHTWPALGEAIAAGQSGDGSGFAAMFADDGATVGALLAIRCLDWPGDPADRDFARVAARAEAAAERSPRFGAHAHWYYAAECLDWPAEPTNPPDELQFDRDVPVLVVGTRWDPATPYTWAERAAASIPGASLLTYEGDGHGASPHSACVREQVAAFLADPDAPGEETCE